MLLPQETHNSPDNIFAAYAHTIASNEHTFFPGYPIYQQLVHTISFMPKRALLPLWNQCPKSLRFSFSQQRTYIAYTLGNPMPWNNLETQQFQRQALCKWNRRIHKKSRACKGKKKTYARKAFDYTQKNRNTRSLIHPSILFRSFKVSSISSIIIHSPSSFPSACSTSFELGFPGSGTAVLVLSFPELGFLAAIFGLSPRFVVAATAAAASTILMAARC